MLMKFSIEEITDSQFAEHSCFLAKNEEGSLVILIKNIAESRNTSEFTSEFLHYKLNNVVLRGNVEEIFVHTILLRKDTTESREQFVTIYNYIFSKFDKKMSAADIHKLVHSINEIFSFKNDSFSDKNLKIGVFGELLVFKYLLDNGITRADRYYHKDFYRKHDMEINSSTRIEIKTVSSLPRIHPFKHDQIVRKDVNVYVASAVVELAETGHSLFDLFNEIISRCSNLELTLALESLKRRCGISRDDPGMHISLEYCLEKIKFYKAADLPQLVSLIPAGVSDVSYKVDCELAPEFDLISMLREME